MARQKCNRLNPDDGKQTFLHSNKEANNIREQRKIDKDRKIQTEIDRDRQRQTEIDKDRQRQTQSQLDHEIFVDDCKILKINQNEKSLDHKKKFKFRDRQRQTEMDRVRHFRDRL